MAFRADARRQAGFTLLEVLIAFAIAAITLVVVIDGSLNALSSSRVARDTQDAVVRARSRLAAFDAGTLAPGEHAGDDGGGFTWRTRVVEVASAIDTRTLAVRSPEFPARPQTLYAVSVRVSWKRAGRERTVELDSARLSSQP